MSEQEKQENDDTVLIPISQETPTSPREDRPALPPGFVGTPTPPAVLPKVWQAVDPGDPLTPHQHARLEALESVRPILGEQQPDVFDLMRLAEWVLTGVDLVDLLDDKEKS